MAGETSKSVTGAGGDDIQTLLAEVGMRSVPDAHVAQWKSAQQSLDAALARLPRDLSWGDEPACRLAAPSRR